MTGTRVSCAAVFAMWHPLYLSIADEIARSLQRRGGVRVTRRFADRATRDEMLQELRSGPDLIVYVGHGRARGWSGYRGVRWSHVSSEPCAAPAGLVLALCCDNLAPSPRVPVPFGELCVKGGYARAFCGATGAVKIEPMLALARLVAVTIREDPCDTAASLVSGVSCRVALVNDVELSATWSAFTLAGDRGTQVFPRARNRATARGQRADRASARHDRSLSMEADYAM